MISGKILRDAIISGANNINNQRSRVDELNVFPVPDGDTGTNMGMTVGASVRELEALDDSCTVVRLPRPLLPPCCAAHAATPVLSPACCSAASPRRWKARRKPPLRHCRGPEEGC